MYTTILLYMYWTKGGGFLSWKWKFFLFFFYNTNFGSFRNYWKKVRFCICEDYHEWDQNVLLLLLFFLENSCLWNHRLEIYKNRPLRWKMLEHLRILLSAQPPPAPFTGMCSNSRKISLTTFQEAVTAWPFVFHRVLMTIMAVGHSVVFVVQPSIFRTTYPEPKQTPSHAPKPTPFSQSYTDLFSISSGRHQEQV